MGHATNSLKISTDVAKRLDITCRKGDTFVLTMTVTDSAGDPVDFSTYADILLQVRPNDEDTGTPIVEILGGDWDTSTVGTLIGTKDAATMAAVDAGWYVYDLQLTDSAGTVVTWFYGIFKINDDVTI